MTEFSGGIEVPVEVLAAFLDAGIYYIGGPDWDTTLPVLCQQFGPELCAVATAAGTLEANSVLLQIHFTQNSDPDVLQFQ